MVALDQKIKASTKELKTLVQGQGSTLMDLTGVGRVVAARILADVGDVVRFEDRNRFASWTGTAPLDTLKRLWTGVPAAVSSVLVRPRGLHRRRRTARRPFGWQNSYRDGQSGWRAGPRAAGVHGRPVVPGPCCGAADVDGCGP